MADITTKAIRAARRRGVTVHTRRQWGSRYASVYAARRKRAVRQPADTVVQHITVTRPSNLKADARAVEQIGYSRFKSGVSYNWLVDMRTGEVAVGQPLDAPGTHTVNDKRVAGYSRDQNYAARAIAVVGMPDTPLSRKAEVAIVELLAAMVEVGAITKGFDYVPHSLFAAKDCPCATTRNRMGAIREAVNAALQPEPKPTRISRARTLLTRARKASKPNTARRRRIDAALDALPKR